MRRTSCADARQSRSKASVNSPGRVAVPRMGHCGGNNPALGDLDNVIAERLCHPASLYARKQIGG